MFLFLPCQKKKREKPRPFLGSKNVIEIPYLFDRPSETSIFAFEKKLPKSIVRGEDAFFDRPARHHAKNFHDSTTR
jgi:hypothetical protein